jgi:carbamoyl-phosphate synthase large subunit
VSSIQAALDAAKEIGYPIILRSAFSLGGLGSGFAHDEEELRNLAAKSLSLSPQVLIEKSLKGWKEVEYEVVRDAADVSNFPKLWLTTEHNHLLQHGEL